MAKTVQILQRAADVRLGVKLSCYGILKASQGLHFLHVGIVGAESNIDAGVGLEPAIAQTGTRRSRYLSCSSFQQNVPCSDETGRVGHIGDERVPVHLLRNIRARLFATR